MALENIIFYMTYCHWAIECDLIYLFTLRCELLSSLQSQDEESLLILSSAQVLYLKLKYKS